jgi:predicted 3-demethylubiquinone-9 3-methyltransferase (glyoxalase superfamily)
MQKITNCLWFDGQALEAAEFYVSVLPNSRVNNIARFPGEGQDVHNQEEGAVMTVEFELEGQKFLSLNGGARFEFNPAISLMVSCETQDEIDALWDGLSADPEAEKCGWLQDRFGISWQIVPTALPRLLSQPDAETRNRVFAQMMTMKKLDIGALEAAARNS